MEGQESIAELNAENVSAIVELSRRAKEASSDGSSPLPASMTPHSPVEANTGVKLFPRASFRCPISPTAIPAPSPRASHFRTFRLELRRRFECKSAPV